MRRTRGREGILPAPDFTFLTSASPNPLLAGERCTDGNVCPDKTSHVHSHTHTKSELRLDRQYVKMQEKNKAEM